MLPAEIPQCRLDGVHVGDIHRAVPGTTQLIRQRCESVAAQIDKAHRPAPLMEQTRRGRANAGGRAGNQNIVHVGFLIVVVLPRTSVAIRSKPSYHTPHSAVAIRLLAGPPAPENLPRAGSPD